MPKLILEFRRGKRNLTLSASDQDLTEDSSELEVHFDKKNPVTPEEFLKVAAQTYFLLTKLGTSILDTSYEEADARIAIATGNLERQHGNRNFKQN